MSSFGFDGSTAFIALPAAGIVTTFPASVEAWVYVPNVTCKGAIIKLGDGTHGWGMGIGKGTANVWDTAGTTAVYLSGLFENVAWLYTTSSGTADPLTVGWNHCVMTVDSAVNSYAVLFYVNGVSFTNANPGQTPNAPSGAFGIGGYNSTRFFAGEAGGRLAYCAVYNKVLSAARVSAHYATASDATYAAAVLVDAPTGFWQLQDSSTSAPADSSGNNHPATGNGGLTASLVGPFAAAAVVAGVPRRRVALSRRKPTLAKRKLIRRRIFDGNLVLSPVPPRRKKVKPAPPKAPARRKIHPFRFSQFVVAAALAMVPPRHRARRYRLILQANRPPRRLIFPRRVIGTAATTTTSALSVINVTTATTTLVSMFARTAINTITPSMSGLSMKQAFAAVVTTTGSIVNLARKILSAANTTTATEASTQAFGYVLNVVNTTTGKVGQFLSTKIATTMTATGSVVQLLKTTIRGTVITTGALFVKALHVVLLTLVARMSTTAMTIFGLNTQLNPYGIEVTKVTSVTSITVTNVRKVF